MVILMARIHFWALGMFLHVAAWSPRSTFVAWKQHVLHSIRTSFIDAKKCQEGETIEFLQNGARRCGTLVMKRPGKHRETPGPTMERPGNRPWNSMVAPGAGIRGSDGGDSKPAGLGE